MSVDRSEFIHVKKSKYKRSPHTPMNEIPVSNRFEGAEVDPELQTNLEIDNQPSNGKEWKTRKPKFYKKGKKGVETKTKGLHLKEGSQDYLVQFENEILRDIPDKCVFNFLHKLDIMKTPKQMLKKCRFCNFKKRSCLLEPESCQAKKKVCWNCEKLGHFTQSLCCKKRQRSTRRKLVKVYTKEPKSTLLTKENLNLILRRIEKLETDDKEKNES